MVLIVVPEKNKTKTSWAIPLLQGSARQIYFERQILYIIFKLWLLIALVFKCCLLGHLKKKKSLNVSEWDHFFAI